MFHLVDIITAETVYCMKYVVRNNQEMLQRKNFTCESCHWTM